MKNKVVMITGATSGIGKACCYEFASKGCNIIMLARRREKLAKIADDLQKQYQIKVYFDTCDVRNYSEVENFVAALPQEWKNIDILINNAGLARGLEKIQDGVISKWEEMIDTNVKGLLYVTRLVLPNR